MLTPRRAPVRPHRFQGAKLRSPAVVETLGAERFFITAAPELRCELRADRTKEGTMVTGAAQRGRGRWKRAKSRRKLEKVAKNQERNTMAANGSVGCDPPDKLLLSALKYWEVERDLIEERLATEVCRGCVVSINTATTYGVRRWSSSPLFRILRSTSSLCSTTRSFSLRIADQSARSSASAYCSLRLFGENRQDCAALERRRYGMAIRGLASILKLLSSRLTMVQRIFG